MASSTLRTLDVRRMRVLREVARRGTIAAAARALDFTPSAVSQQLPAFAPGVVARPVADVPVTRRIYAAARRGALARPALAAMVDALQEAALTVRP